MNSLAPIGVSTYSRLGHLKLAIEALKANDLASQSDLYVFSDAPKSGDELAVESVRSYLKGITGFKRVVVVERVTNDRVFNNRDGMARLLSLYGKMIFLEEDIVTSRGFLTYMNGALDYYRDTANVNAVCGYRAPFKLPKRWRSDVFFMSRFSAWGFATWAEKFSPFGFEIENADAARVQIDSVSARRKLRVFGADLHGMVASQLEGKIEALDVKVMYHNIVNDKYCVYPRESLVRNVGLDGSGIHCGKTDRFDPEILWEKRGDFGFQQVLVDRHLIKAHAKFRAGNVRSRLGRMLINLGVRSLGTNSKSIK